MVNRIVYIANARLPTEKAHGYQICKMCEAFVRNDAAVTLMHPYRHQFTPELTGQSIFDYYGIPRCFQLRTLPNLDIVMLDRWVPDKVLIPMFFAHALLWAFYSALIAYKEKADVYYTRDSEVAYWLVRLGLPTVYEAHVIPKRGQRWLLRRIASHPGLRLVVVLTTFIREKFIAMGFPAEKIVVLPDGVDLALFEDLPSKEECRRRLGLPLERPIIGYIGRFRTMQMEKGIPQLVETIRSLPSLNGFEPLLLCVGGPMEAVSAYLNLACRLGVPEQRLRFVDRIPNREVPYWIRACDVVTIPWPWTEFSAYFTSPLKLFEYLAAGVPIVATDLPSIREVLRHGENAWLVEPDNPQALAGGIQRLLDDRGVNRKIAAKARQDAQSYTWDRRASAILKHPALE